MIRAADEAEVALILKAADRLDLPVTFRAAGTSLSGQAVSDSILVVAGESWNRWEIMAGASRSPATRESSGATPTVYLAPYGKKIGPDPASINAAMIGGIAANNASGMCCGTAQNSYRTLASMRIIFADGPVLDTGTRPAGRQFRPLARRHAEQDRRPGRDASQANTPLAERAIRRKFTMKNTTGYSLNALVDFDDPFEIIQHLMIGSEGTLGFIAEITFHHRRGASAQSQRADDLPCTSKPPVWRWRR